MQERGQAADGYRRGIRLFAAPADQPRARRGTDVVLLLAALLGLGIAIIAYPPSAFERSLQRFLASIPGWLDPVWGSFSDLTWLWAIVLVVLALVRRRWFVVGQALAAAVLAALIGLAASRLATGSWPDPLGRDLRDLARTAVSRGPARRGHGRDADGDAASHPADPRR